MASDRNPSSSGGSWRHVCKLLPYRNRASMPRGKWRSNPNQDVMLPCRNIPSARGGEERKAQNESQAARASRPRSTQPSNDRSSTHEAEPIRGIVLPTAKVPVHTTLAAHPPSHPTPPASLPSRADTNPSSTTLSTTPQVLPHWPPALLPNPTHQRALPPAFTQFAIRPIHFAGSHLTYPIHLPSSRPTASMLVMLRLLPAAPT